MHSTRRYSDADNQLISEAIERHNGDKQAAYEEVAKALKRTVNAISIHWNRHAGKKKKVKKYAIPVSDNINLPVVIKPSEKSITKSMAVDIAEMAIRKLNPAERLQLVSKMLSNQI